MKPLILAVCGLALFPITGYAHSATIIRDTVACDSIGWFMMLGDLERDGDEVAAKKFKAQRLRRFDCKKFRKGTRIHYYHLSDYTDGDYPDYTTVRPTGDIAIWVVDKCALDVPDADVIRIRGDYYRAPTCPNPEHHGW